MAAIPLNRIGVYQPPHKRPDGPQPTFAPPRRRPLDSWPMNVPRLSLLTALGLLHLVACAQPAPKPGPSGLDAPVPTTHLAVHPQEYSRLFEAACLVLEDMGFAVPRRDYRFGQIATSPLNNPVIIEFWKPTHDRGLAMALQSTFNDQRRVARLFFEPYTITPTQSPAEPFTAGSPAPPTPGPQPRNPDPDSPSAYTFRVEVIIERLQQPARYLTNSAHRPALRLTDIPVEVAAVGVHGPYWQPVTRDDALAAVILERTVRRSLELSRPETPAPALPVESF
jgi:hypothetical protein